MASTYLSLHYHLVFSTRDREEFIVEAIRKPMHDYLAGTVLGLKGHCRAVGGSADHVHLLIGLGATHTLSDFVRELKKASSKWAREQASSRRFAWQEGYAAFTVSASATRDVQRYIANQEEHHRKRSFRDELKMMLDKSGVVYDERYLD
jgi:REP element-mobilizing transposase RayT